MKYSDMEENLHKDNLESFFKQAFDKLPDTPSPDGWDTPSEEVWDGIIAVKPGSNGLFPFSWKILVLGLFLLGLAGTTVYFWQQNNKLKQQVKLQATTIESLNQNLKEEQTTDIATAMPDRTEASGQTEPVNTAPAVQKDNYVNPTYPVKSIKENALTDLPDTDKTNLEINESVISGTPSEIAESSNADENGIAGKKPTKAVEAPFLQNNLKAPAHLPAVENLTVNQSFLALPERPHGQLPIPGDIKPVGNLSFYAGAYIAPNFTNSHTKTIRGPLLFRSMEKESWSHERGVKAGMIFSNGLKISTALGFYDAALMSRQKFRITYDPSIETPVDNEYESTYTLSVPSSYGSTEMEVDFRRSSSDQLSQGQNVLLDVITRQRLKFVNIPLLVGYESGVGKFKYALQTGLALNILNTSTFGAEVQSRSLKLRRFNGPRVTKQFTETRKIGYDYVLTAGLSYEITPAVRISFEPHFRTNITPLVSTEDFSNRMNSFSFHTGAYLRF
jgi:hypothetical protein